MIFVVDFSFIVLFQFCVSLMRRLDNSLLHCGTWMCNITKCLTTNMTLTWGWRMESKTSGGRGEGEGEVRGEGVGESGWGRSEEEGAVQPNA